MDSDKKETVKAVTNQKKISITLDLVLYLVSVAEKIFKKIKRRELQKSLLPLSWKNKNNHARSRL